MTMSTRGCMTRSIFRLARLRFGKRAKLSRVLTDDDGAALVEFTILMPVLFLILFGIIEFGSMIFTQNNMTNAAREGARTSAVQGGTMANANTYACKFLAGSGMTFTIKSTTVASASTCPDVQVQVSVPTATASLFNTFFGFSGGNITANSWAGTISASATMRSEITNASSCIPVGSTATCSCNTAVNPASGC
ncbi:MAG TPA: TadE/TadG family type IV pilus assembly protein [Xanthobacteraceae bacterium]|nr:TadE/TadG family type IV pilus assembly protein [Xanthobacteraceae bacterium]